MGDNMETLIVEITLTDGTHHIHNVFIIPKGTSWEPQFHEIAEDYNASSHLWDDKDNPGGKSVENCT